MSTLADVQRTTGPGSGILSRSRINPSAKSFSPSVATPPVLQESASSPSAWSEPRSYHGASELSSELYRWLTVSRRTTIIELTASWAGPDDVFDKFQPQAPQTTAIQPSVSDTAGEDDSWWSEAQVIPALRTLDLATIEEDDEHWPLPYGHREILAEQEASVIAEAQRRGVPDWVKHIREMLEE